jgi:hypothetical protein
MLRQRPHYLYLNPSILFFGFFVGFPTANGTSLFRSVMYSALLQCLREGSVFSKLVQMMEAMLPSRSTAWPHLTHFSLHVGTTAEKRTRLKLEFTSHSSAGLSGHCSHYTPLTG